MRHTECQWRGWTLREWACCGLLWQLLLTRRFPGRESWRPTCPRCGCLAF